MRIQTDGMPVIGFGFLNVIELLIGGSEIGPGISDVGLKFRGALIML